MDHTRARSIFAEIQERPFGVSEDPGTPSNNCYWKGKELLQRIGTLGYTVRGRVGDTYWDNRIIPQSLIDTLPADLQVTHFFVEVLLNGEWRTLDPTFQPALAQYGFAIGSWDPPNAVCFPITKLYTQEESMAYQEKWFDHHYQKEWFDRSRNGWQAFNRWFSTL